MDEIRGENRKYERAGLTLIELLVSLFIISFITAIFVSNYRVSNKRTDLIMSSQVVVSDIHRAQNNALGLMKYGEEVPAGGWGVNFNTQYKNQYVIFADLQAPGETGYRMYDSYTEGDVNKGARIISFPPEIELVSLRLSETDTVPRYWANVTFLPPDPQTNIYSLGATSTELLVNVREVRSGTIKTIKINFLGLAEVEDFVYEAVEPAGSNDY